MAIQIIPGKYQIKNNIYSLCVLDVLDANDQEFRAYIGLKERGDASVAVGTKIFFNADKLNQALAGSVENTFATVHVTVTKTESDNGKTLHICTPVTQQHVTERRTHKRHATEFFVRLKKNDAALVAQNGSSQGLRLLYKSKSPILAVSLDQSYEFILEHKGTEHTFNGTITHVHYDWKSSNHFIGVHFKELDDNQQTILNLLVDPDYEVDISHNENIDTASGKIGF